MQGDARGRNGDAREASLTSWLEEAAGWERRLSDAASGSEGESPQSTSSPSSDGRAAAELAAGCAPSPDGKRSEACVGCATEEVSTSEPVGLVGRLVGAWPVMSRWMPHMGQNFHSRCSFVGHCAQSIAGAAADPLSREAFA